MSSVSRDRSPLRTDILPKEHGPDGRAPNHPEKTPWLSPVGSSHVTESPSFFGRDFLFWVPKRAWLGMFPTMMAAVPSVARSQVQAPAPPLTVVPVLTGSCPLLPAGSVAACGGCRPPTGPDWPDVEYVSRVLARHCPGFKSQLQLLRCVTLGASARLFEPWSPRVQRPMQAPPAAQGTWGHGPDRPQLPRERLSSQVPHTGLWLGKDPVLVLEAPARGDRMLHVSALRSLRSKHGWMLFT